ncbi:MAG: ABC transporter permease [Pleurocapsa minor GSE-CHR-MK-17-07R]|jgi:simple sugar transport system permease protein|nr:ABC transporter permease [Pleurocapsa minor GSE-CHR-MK 17-07R]
MIDILQKYQRILRILLLVGGIAVVLFILFGLPITLLQSSIRLATPYVLGALAAIVASRAGVLNLAIEGMMLLGAFIAVAVLYQTGFDPLVGVLAATLAGGLLGIVFAVLYLRIKINLIILALAVNLFISNATVYFMRTQFGAFGTLADPSIQGLPRIDLPLISQIPYIGSLISGHNAVVYFSWIMVAVVWVILFRTQFGRHLRAVGENKAAAESVGINITRVQIFALTVSGMLAGMAGSFLSIGVLSQFVENMTAGRGWTAITVALFAFEQPIPSFFTALFFGLSEAMSFFLQSRPELSLPPDLLLALPQIATIAALVIVALRIRAGELLKRRAFATEFGRELAKLGKGQLVGGGD